MLATVGLTGLKTFLSVKKPHPISESRWGITTKQPVEEESISEYHSIRYRAN
jgi:hypothetical protein